MTTTDSTTYRPWWVVSGCRTGAVWWLVLGLTGVTPLLTLWRWNLAVTVLAVAGAACIAAGSIAWWALNRRAPAASQPPVSTELKVITVGSIVALPVGTIGWFVTHDSGWLFVAQIASIGMAARWSERGWQPRRPRVSPWQRRPASRS
ncbi:hypothetical protein [Nakamurella endophytica]|uniref:Uncharacterized protein n=1 Tax=Nakamurella endophytica TaxID=1748367 RepID=A0A917T3C0_9ACTN|nr:hypothetical protein [Nakamurella endophytica]GGM09432.1 hypothetical protein GCM10011594_31620 [Nakamurella endophytica]